MNKKLTHREIQKEELKILLDFDSFCKEHKLKYYLAGGTLLGAIRHKGFIPWDDDIDVCMSRLDYEKLLKIFPEIYKEKYQLKALSRKNFDLPFSKLINKNIYIKNSYTNNKLDMNLWIDIFPVDGVPENNDDIKHLYKKRFFWGTLLFFYFVKLGSGDTYKKKIRNIFIIFLSKIMGKNFLIRKVEKLTNLYDFNTSKYVGTFNWGGYGSGGVMRKEDFIKQTEVIFEGYIFPTFSCWEKYLQGLYKDYKKLPPKNKQRTHQMEAYLKGE